MQCPGARQSFPALPSVMTIALGKSTEIVIFLFFCIPLTQTVQIYITCHIYITNITIITYISQRNHFHTLYHNHNSNNNISQPQVKYHNHKSQIHNHSPSSPSTSHNHKWSSSPSTWRSTTPQKGGLWHDGEAKAPSFGDAWAGLFEPADGSCKKDKRLHVWDSSSKFLCEALVYVIASASM